MLEAYAPDWVTKLTTRGPSSDWLAYPPLHSGEPIPAVVVRITVQQGWLDVQEATPGTRLPAKCPQLHINTDSTFCLAYRGYRSDDGLDVSCFWQHLGEYLINQDFAHSRRRWPSGRWISHGSEAAECQLQAERQATVLGCHDAYQECLELGTGWIGALVADRGAKVHGAALCPLGCVDTEGRSATLRTCGHLFAIRRLIKTEGARRGEEKRFFSHLTKRGHACCDRVEGCPLKIEEDAA